MKNINYYGIILAIVAASLYAINSPLSKIMLDYMPKTLMAGTLYLGAGLGMTIIFVFRKIVKNEKLEERLSKKELPYTIMMILLDIAAPIFLLYGLNMTTSSTVSLLNNFEIVVTALIAFAIFKEKISVRLWIGIIFITLSCMSLSLENINSFKFSFGAIFVIIACVCWGIENNCTRKISSKDPLQIVFIKGLFSGLGSIIIGLIIGERFNSLWSVFVVLGIGLFAYGLSIFFYVHAQRIIGAARTSAYYAIAPFVGTALSLIILKEKPLFQYFIALFLMLIGAWLCSSDKKIFKKSKRKVLIKK